MEENSTPYPGLSDLKSWVRRPAALGLRLATRAAALGKKRVIAAVARKLAVALHNLWESEEVYRPWHLLDKCFEEANIGRRNIYASSKTEEHFQW